MRLLSAGIGIRFFAGALVGAFVCVACAGGGEPEVAAIDSTGSPPAGKRDCGIPSSTSTPRVTLPAPWTLDGRADVLHADEDEDGWTTAVVRLDGYTVKQGYEAYQASATKAGFDLAEEDFEGFEAELYLSRGEEIGFVKLRQTECPDVTLVQLKLR
jgi:hypothetical protein